MDKRTALIYIDRWANFYLRILGESDKLELIEKDFYTILRPRDDKWASIFDVRLEDLSDEDLTKTVDEIKAMKKHVWWNQYSDKVTACIFPEGRREPTPNDDEVFAVMTRDELPDYPSAIIDVRRAKTPEDFEAFHSVCFDKTLSSNNLFNLHNKGLLDCYLGCKDSFVVAATALLKNGQVYSLELASTLSRFRGMGYATAVCQAALNSAFRESAEVVTIRAGGGPAANEVSKLLGKKLGFEYI